MVIVQECLTELSAETTVQTTTKKISIRKHACVPVLRLILTIKSC